MKTVLPMKHCVTTTCLLIALLSAIAALAQPVAPVDTRQLALIRPGMSQAEVRRRLGDPAEVVDLGYREYTDYNRRYRSKTTRMTHLEKWIYPGNYSYGPAGIVFENGVEKSRERE